jgi:hypothetical protein
MTEHEYTTLLDLANTWQAASEVFEKSKRENSRYAKQFQAEGNFDRRNVYMGLAASDEIRAEVLAGASKKLALKLGELWKANPPHSEPEAG